MYHCMYVCMYVCVCTYYDVSCNRDHCYVFVVRVRVSELNNIYCNMSFKSMVNIFNALSSISCLMINKQFTKA